MDALLRSSFLMKATLILIVVFMMGCGGSDSKGPSLQEIPRYPNAIESESIDQSGFAGLGGSLVQYTTTDSYNDVKAFYIDALSDEETDVLSYKSDLGRQVIISTRQDNGVISIAIQEFTRERRVSITLMGLGS